VVVHHASSMAPPAANKFLPRELFFMLVGIVSAGGAAVVVLRVLPEAMTANGVEVADLGWMARVALNRAFQVIVLLAGMLLVSAGAATRSTLGLDRATWLLAGGASLLFAVLGFVAYATFDPALAGAVT
jgi:hypothetical protein